MKTELAIRRELARCNNKKLRWGANSLLLAELYGIQQALEWVLKNNVMAPVRCATLGQPSSEPSESKEKL